VVGVLNLIFPGTSLSIQFTISNSQYFFKNNLAIKVSKFFDKNKIRIKKSKIAFFHAKKDKYFLYILMREARGQQEAAGQLDGAKTELPRQGKY